MTKRTYLAICGLALAMLAALGFWAQRRAEADVAKYAGARRQIRACVLTFEAIGDAPNNPQNVVPHLFYVLEGRADLKPAGWEFVNPIAPSVISPEMYRRWQNRGGANDPAFQNNTSESLVFRPGQPLTKDMGAYWEVNLDRVSESDMQSFDVAFFGGTGVRGPLTSGQREKLRRFVDGGGTLWLEDEGGFVIGANGAGPFVVDVEFNGGVINQNTVPVVRIPRHPLLNFPYPIAPLEARRLGQGGYANRRSHSGPGNTPLARSFMVPVISVGGGTESLVTAGDLGGGHLVVSSAGVAGAITGYVGGANLGGYPNTGAVSGGNLIAAPPTELKFAYNLIQWASSVPMAGGNARRRSSTTELLSGAPALRWRDTPVTAANPGSGAVLYKGVMYAIDGSNRLSAFDVDSEEDLDGDQNPDDGIQDLSFGSPFDRLYSISLSGFAGGGRLSTPTIITYFDTNAGREVDALCVTNTQGETAVYNVTLPARGVPFGTNPNPPQLGVIGGGAPDMSGALIAPEGPLPGILSMPAPSPVASEGVLFTVVYNNVGANAQPDNFGGLGWRVYPVDPLTRNNVFGDPNAMAPYPLAPATGMGAPTGPLAVGYVRDVTTGAIDKVVTVPTRTVRPDVGGEKLESLWFSTRGEPLRANGPNLFSPVGRRANVPWYAPPQNVPGNADLFPTIHLVRTRRDADNIESVVEVRLLRFRTDFTVRYEGSPGAVREIRAEVPGLPVLPANESIQLFADYTCNWALAPLQGQNGSTQPTAQEMQLLAQARGFTLWVPNQITGGNVHRFTGGAAMTALDATVFNSQPPGSVPGRVYAVRDQFDIGAGTTNTARHGTEAAWMWSPNGPVGAGNIGVGTRLVDRSGAVAVPLTDFRPVGAPAVANGVVYSLGRAGGSTVILALNANPTMTITVGTPLPPRSQAAEILLQQPPTIPGGNEPFVTLREDVNFSVDRTNGTITIFNARSASGEVFNSALPVYLGVGGPPGAAAANSQLGDPIGGTRPLDNLLWYMVIPQNAINNDPNNLIVATSGPSVAGDAIHFGTGSGKICSVRIRAASDGSQQPVVANGELQVALSEPAQVNPANPALPALNNPIIHPPAATAGVVGFGSGQGAAALENQITTIADATRIIQVNRAVEAVWSVDGTRTNTFAGDLSNFQTARVAQQRTGFANPSVVRRLSLNDYLVVDTGNNRVVQMDRGGTVLSEIRTLNNGLSVLRGGDPLTLSGPTDVQTYTEFVTALSFPNRSTGDTYAATGAGPYYVIHYLIADTGNNRMIEVVDAFDAAGQAAVVAPNNVVMRRQVVFVTRSLSEQNSRLRYRTIQQFIDPTSIAAGPPFQQFLISAVENLRVGPLDPANVPNGLNDRNIGSETGNVSGLGGAVVFLRRDYSANAANNKDGDVALIVSSVAFPDNPFGATPAILKKQQISGPTFFKQYDVGSPVNGTRQARYLLADANGVYLLRPGRGVNQATGQTEDAALVEWSLSGDDYYYLTGRRLQAVSVQKLTLADFDAARNRFFPRFLITNAYTGKDDVRRLFPAASLLGDGTVGGEVVEVRSRDYYLSQAANGLFNGYNSPTTQRLYDAGGQNGALRTNPNSAITWIAPREEFPTALRPGVIRRRIGSVSNGTSAATLDQPGYAER